MNWKEWNKQAQNKRKDAGPYDPEYPIVPEGSVADKDNV